MQHATLPTKFRLATLVAVGALAFAACGGDDEGTMDDADDTPGADDVTPDDGIALLAVGGERTYRVAPSYEVGQRAESELAMRVSVSTVGQSESVGLDMMMEQRVTAHDEDSTTVEMTVTDVEVTDAPAGAEQMMEGLIEKIVEKTIVTQFDENGQQTGEAKMKDGGDIPDEFEEGFSDQSQAVFPTEEIGVGSRWSQVTETDSNGVEFEFTTVYELTEITTDELVLTMTQEAPIETEASGTDVSGSLTGSGEMRIDRANPLVINGSYGLDVFVEADGESVELGLDLDVASS